MSNQGPGGLRSLPIRERKRDNTTEPTPTPTPTPQTQTYWQPPPPPQTQTYWQPPPSAAWPSSGYPQPWTNNWASLNPWQQFCLQSWQGHVNPYGQMPNIGMQASGQLPQHTPQHGANQSIALKQNEYGSLHTVLSRGPQSFRVDKLSRIDPNKGLSKGQRKRRAKQLRIQAQVQAQEVQAQVQAQVEVPTRAPLRSPIQSPLQNRAQKHKESKIMMPAPPPSHDYLTEAQEEAFVIDPPDRMLVILDLNGTLIYRPNRKQPTKMIKRPFLKPFLRYLFENFTVMVWSSAKPENVKILVENVLDDELQSKLVASWARDTFGLTPDHYDKNVQVYKNLDSVWEDEKIQQSKLGYSFGKRFSQDNTILIDDSKLKANAQPHNLIEIPEFIATEEQMKSDILREVAGYLETAKMQNNVSSFIREQPFQADAKWMYDWPDEIASEGELTGKVSV